jgi:glycosyltransferase involved in cell wall biosynthesis
VKVTAFTRYGRRAASTRQRFVQYFPALRESGIEVEHLPLLGDDYVANLVTGEPYPPARVVGAYAQRLRQLLTGRDSDLYWVYVELLPYVPALPERLAARGKRIVYDFDDAFFHTYDQSRNPLVRALLGGKHAAQLKRAAACVCGNDYIERFAARHCDRTMVVPTVVDTEAYQPAAGGGSEPMTIGWIGSPTTWPGVRPILPILEDICARYGARFLVVGAGREAERDAFPAMVPRDWSEATEISDVQSMDIGIMPLLDRPFERGKSGYKLIQYMACGLPVVASPIGVNTEIVKEGVNGLLASSAEEWRAALSSLVLDSGLRAALGAAGRVDAAQRFSLASQTPRLIELFNRVAQTRGHFGP